MDSDGNYSFYQYIGGKVGKSLKNFIGEYDEWGYLHTFADWTRDAFNEATGINLDVDDYFGSETPRELSQTIKEKGANTPQNPATNENNNSSSF